MTDISGYIPQTLMQRLKRRNITPQLFELGWELWIEVYRQTVWFYHNIISTVKGSFLFLFLSSSLEGCSALSYLKEKRYINIYYYYFKNWDLLCAPEKRKRVYQQVDVCIAWDWDTCWRRICIDNQEFNIFLYMHQNIFLFCLIGFFMFYGVCHSIS